MTDFKSINHSDKKIVVLGTGCKKCKTLETLVRKIVKENAINASIEKVEDLMKIMEYGVMSTPALVINGEVKIKGRVPKEKELLEIINA